MVSGRWFVSYASHEHGGGRVRAPGTGMGLPRDATKRVYGWERRAQWIPTPGGKGSVSEVAEVDADGSGVGWGGGGGKRRGKESRSRKVWLATRAVPWQSGIARSSAGDRP